MRIDANMEIALFIPLIKGEKWENQRSMFKVSLSSCLLLVWICVFNQNNFEPGFSSTKNLE